MIVSIRESRQRREDIFERLRTERNRSGWAHQHELWPCLTGSQRVLTADLRWKAIADIRVGDEVVAFDESTPGAGRPRRWRIATVTGTSHKQALAERYEFDDGSAIEATPDHRVLSCEGWSSIGNTSRVRKLVRPWSNDATWERGYLAGVFDGEGSIGRYEYSPRSTATRLSFVQAEWRKLLDTPLKTRHARKVNAIALGTCTVYDIETTTGTFVAEGFAVHNCARKGAAERWLEQRGTILKPGKASALYFMRGNLAEGHTENKNFPKILVVYRGVAATPDQWTGDPARPFEELKSTNFSSFAWYKLVEAGQVDMRSDFPMRNYLEQCAIYCVALGATGCYLTIFFLHGDYADRRKSCPACGGALGPWVDDYYKVCGDCGYKSKKSDLWTYEIDFSPEYLAHIDAEVYGFRAPAFYAAIRADSAEALCEAAPATPNFYCASCRAGEAVGCESFGTAYR